MANNQHFLKFRIENFKRFDEFEMDNLGQFNLIVGDNNVGKSSVLEALMFDKDGEEFLRKLYNVLCVMKHFDGLKEWFMKQYLKTPAKTNPHRITFEAKTFDNNKIQYWLYYSDRSHQWQRGSDLMHAGENKNENYTQGTGDVPYIPFQLSYTHEMTDFYARNIQLNKIRKEQLLNDLQVILADIQNLEINTVVAEKPVILITRQSTDANLPLGTYGDGVIKLFRILIEMQIHAGKRLMIDEIDTGIHFSRMKLFWKTVIRSAKNNDVQLFATTHSDECITCYKEAMDEEGEEIKNDSRIVRMTEVNHETQLVKAFTYKYHEYGHAVDIGNELR